MFNKKAASKKSKPDEIIKALEIKPGQKIADIGSGGGYFTLRFAEAVGKNGEVFAVDTSQDNLDFIKAKDIPENLKLVCIDEGKLTLPEKHFDLIFFRNVYHHLKNRIEYIKKVKTKLKPGGRIAIVEYKPGGSIFSFRRLFGHNVPAKIIINECEQAGLKKLKEFTFLPEQSFTLFG